LYIDRCKMVKTNKQKEKGLRSFKSKDGKSNMDILTSGFKNYEKKRKFNAAQIEEIKFDDQKRREFLTGFQKRNKEKREAAIKNAKKRELLERKEIVKEQRIEKMKSIQPMIELLEEGVF